MSKTNAFDDYENHLCENLMIKARETEEEFIFTTISPFIDGIAEKHIPKEDLVKAITLIKLREKAVKLYGVELSLDWDTATKQSQELEKAYNRGYCDGISVEKERLKGYLEE